MSAPHVVRVLVLDPAGHTSEVMVVVDQALRLECGCTRVVGSHPLRGTIRALDGACGVHGRGWSEVTA